MPNAIWLSFVKCNTCQRNRWLLNRTYIFLVKCERNMLRQPQKKIGARPNLRFRWAQCFRKKWEKKIFKSKINGLKTFFLQNSWKVMLGNLFGLPKLTCNYFFSEIPQFCCDLHNLYKIKCTTGSTFWSRLGLGDIKQKLTIISELKGLVVVDEPHLM